MAIPVSSLLLLLLISAAAADGDAGAGDTSTATATDLHHIELLSPILLSLGYQQMAMAVNSVFPSPIHSNFTGAVTIFAPSDDSVRSCAPPCSPLLLLLEHLVPGLLSASDLAHLPFASKLPTAADARCLTLTSTASRSKLFLDGVEIARPDLFNDGIIAIHGLQGFVAPLSPNSCAPVPNALPPPLLDQSPIPPVALLDAIVRLHRGGYSVLALALHIKHAEMEALHNMTVFALGDEEIFAGGENYVGNVRFHIVPGRVLVHADLLRLAEGSVLPTLVHGQHLVVTHSGKAAQPAMGLRINYVGIRAPDVIYNVRIAVHGIYMPFPHLFPVDQQPPAVPDVGGTFGAMGCVCGGGGAAAAAAPAVSVPGGR